MGGKRRRADCHLHKVVIEGKGEDQITERCSVHDEE